ncbi:flagella synthesis protein FlgN [Niveibacterium terrae]|uniref:flagella synthesis protein FlgN n=1 Tax=Niveibacterium terrae TaxID=3373598 RepID=UPI003A901CC5
MPSFAAIRFSALLSENTGQLVHFVELLKHEQELLVEGRVEELLALAEDKTAAVRQMQNAENSRALALGADGIDPSAESVAAFVQGKGKTLEDAWARYLSLAREASELNQINGKLIRQHMQNNQLALSVLLSASEIPLYNADGLSPAKPPGRLLGTF